MSYFTYPVIDTRYGARRRRTHYLAQTFVSARRSSAPSVLCAPCLKGRGQSAAPGRLDRTLGSGQSSPRPTATNFTQAEAFGHQFEQFVNVLHMKDLHTCDE